MAPVVMVVDDDDGIREALTDVLGEEGYVVVGARNGREALAQLKDNLMPRAIIVDLWMPEMDGWQLRNELLKDAKWVNIPLIVLTAARGKAVPTLPAAEVLEKPIELSLLLGVLKRLVTDEGRWRHGSQ
jgi:CheY-like chemotaxis protein